MEKMLWIVPSRSRPSNVANLIAQIYKTRCMTDVLFVIDNDDEQLDEYRRVLLGFQGFHWLNFVETDRLRLGPKLNKFATMAAGDYDFIGFMGDDHKPLTPIWDGMMAAQMRVLGSGVVYGNDLFQGKKLPTSVLMSSDIINALGFMVPPTLFHLYIDNFWLDLGRELGRIEYMEHVLIEHVHPHAGKAESDAQYEAVNSNSAHERDRHAYETYLRRGFASDVARVKEILK